MAKKPEAATAATPATAGSEASAAPETAVKANQGVAVILPNGQRRSDFIRDAYYSKEPPYGYVEGKSMKRGDIKKAINEMLKGAGIEKQIAYQIVFGATKEATDPRKKAAAAAPAASA